MHPVAYTLYLVVVAYGWLIVARAVLSWVPMRYGSAAHRAYGVLVRVTEPYLAIFRRLLPTSRVGSVGIDWSALVGLVVLFIVAQLLARLNL